MKWGNVVLLLQAIVLCAESASGLYRKIIHNTDIEAKCLDGSPSALYIHEGKYTDKILVLIQEGDFCKAKTPSGTLEQCYKRSKTSFGSSKKMPESLSFEGILSTEPAKSLFAEWTKVFIPSCDGSFYQGHRSQPIQYKDTTLYFRGSLIMKSSLQYLQKTYNLSQASKIVFSGRSAGAVACLLWSDYLLSLVEDDSKVYIIPDSGIFLNSVNQVTKSHLFGTQLHNLYELANLDESAPITRCNIVHHGEQWKCILTQYNYPYLNRANILFINSEYDSYSILHILGIPCLQSTNTGFTLKKCSQAQLQVIEQYRDEYSMLLYEIMQISDSYSFWSISCSYHLYTGLDRFYSSSEQEVGDMTVKQTVEMFVFEGQKLIKKDHHEWPWNKRCAY